MSDLETLFRLHTVDAEIDDRTRRLEQVRASLGETEELRETRRALEAARKRLHELEQVQRSLEWDVDDRSSRIRLLETKLYGGTIKNPKELASLQTEIEHMKVALSDAEGLALQAISNVEEAATEAARLTRALAEIEQRWSSRQTELAAEKVALETALGALGQKRQEPVAALTAPLLLQYDQIRKRRGTAVARVDRNMCLGCRTTVATAQVQSARLGKIANCSACGRILYLGR